MFALTVLLAACQSQGTEQVQETSVTETAPPETYTIEEFMETTSIRGSSFSPDHSKILYSSNQTGIYNAFEVRVAGGEPKQLTESTDNTIFTISYFPEDERLLYASDQGGN